jgi:hypothetical protein
MFLLGIPRGIGSTSESGSSPVTLRSIFGPIYAFVRFSGFSPRLLPRAIALASRLGADAKEIRGTKSTADPDLRRASSACHEGASNFVDFTGVTSDGVIWLIAGRR